MRKVKSILSIVLVLCMLMSTFTVAFAQETGATPAAGNDDETPPEIDLSTLTISDTEIERGEAVTVRVKVTDASDIVRISVMYHCNGAINGGGASYYYSNDFDAALYDGEYFASEVRFGNDPAYYGLYEINSIEAMDAYGNITYVSRYAHGTALDSGTFRVTGDGFVENDTAGPVIDYENIVIADQVNAGEKAKITVPITDASEIYSVQVEYGSANTKDAASVTQLTYNSATGLYEGELAFRYLGENHLIDIWAMDANRNETRFINTAYEYYPRDFAEEELTTTVEADAGYANVYYGDPASADTEKPEVELSSLHLEKHVIERDAGAALTVNIRDDSLLEKVGFTFVHVRSGEPYHMGPVPDDTGDATGIYTIELPSAMYGQWKLARVEVIDVYGNAAIFKDSRVLNYSDDLPNTDLSAGDYYVGVIDEATGVSVSDESMGDNTSLSVTENQLSGAVYDQMLEADCTAHAFYDVSVSGDRGTETALLIPAPQGLNEGDAVRVVHLKTDGTTENLDTTVENGLVAVTVKEFSPFLLETGFTPALTAQTVTIEANGVPFMITNPTEDGGSETGMCGMEATHTVEAGKTLSEAGIAVWHEIQHEPFFLGWHVYNLDPATGGWEQAVDNDGNPILLDTNSLNNSFIINKDVRFVAKWQSHAVILEGVSGGTFDVANAGVILMEDVPLAHLALSYMQCLDSLAITVSDVKNGTETFYGWDVYERVEDESNPGTYNLIPLEGPIQDIGSYSITHDVVFQANWTGTAIGGNQGPSIDPGHNLIISSNNGSPFTVRFTDGSDTQFSGYFGTIVGSGVSTLSAMGFASIELDTSTTFAFWSVYAPVLDDNNNIIDWQCVTDENGDPVILENVNDIFTYPIGAGVKFEAEWDLGGDSVRVEANGVHFNVTGYGDITECYSDIAVPLVLGQSLRDLGISISHSANHAQYFVGWTIVENGNAIPGTFSTGYILDYKIQSPDTVFVAEWDGSYTSLVWLTVRGEGQFDLTYVDDGGAHTNEDICYHSFPAGNPGDSFSTVGVTNITTPQHPDGLAFEGWYAYFRGPTDPEFSTTPLNDVDSNGKIIPMSTQQVLTYTNTKVGYTDFIAKFAGVEIDPNGGNQSGEGSSDNIIISSQNGSPFRLTDQDGNSETFPGYFGLDSREFSDTFNTFSDLGLASIALENSSAFAGWVVYRPVFDNDGNIFDWQIETDENGNECILPDINLILTWPINDGVMFAADWTAGGNQSGEDSSAVRQSSGGLAISSDGTFDIVRTNPQGQPETWEDIEHTREDTDVFVGDTLADFGITDITDIKFWDGKREFLGWQVWGEIFVDAESVGYGPLSDKLYTTKEILAYPAAEKMIEFVAVWDGDDADYYTEISFDAVGGQFPVTEYEYTPEGVVVKGEVFVTGTGNTCKENDQPYGEQWGDDCCPIADPVLKGYTFEGWLPVPVNSARYKLSSKLYTTEEVLKLPIPEDNTVYAAKWKEIPMEEYLFGDPYYPYDGQYSELYILGNGGEFRCTVTYEENGGAVTESFIDSWSVFYTEGSMTFEEFHDKWGVRSYTIELTDKTNFEGWITYEADRAYIVRVPKGETLEITDGTFTVMKAGEDTWKGEDGKIISEDSYLLLKNAKVYSNTMTPEEALKRSGKFYATVAQWHVASPNLVNTKSATCTAEGYTGDVVCANCGEVMEQGKAVAKIAHVASPNLVNTKSATHTAEGYTGDVVCANCGEILEHGKAIGKIKVTVSSPVIMEATKISVDRQIEAIVAVISGEKTEKTKTVLTEGTKEAIEKAVMNGQIVGADILIEQIIRDNLAGEVLESFRKEAAAIESKAAEIIGENAVVSEFFDISVIVKNRTTGVTLGNITELDKPVTIVFHIPAALQAENRKFYIIHNHGGSVDLINSDCKDGILTISVGKFSTYALAYADAAVAEPDPEMPPTGDTSNMMLFASLMMIAAVGIYLTSRKLFRA